MPKDFSNDSADAFAYLARAFGIKPAGSTCAMAEEVMRQCQINRLASACHDRVRAMESFPTEEKVMIHIAYEALKHIQDLEKRLSDIRRCGLQPIVIVTSEEARAAILDGHQQKTQGE